MRRFTFVALGLAVSLFLVSVVARGVAHGYVYDASTPGADHRLAGALVVLDDGSGALRTLRTDTRGRFRVFVDPFRDEEHRILVCGRGRLPVTGEIPAGLFPGGYGLPVRDPDAASNVRSFGWTAEVPGECGPQLPGRRGR